jgi:hypothetical protein
MWNFVLGSTAVWTQGLLLVSQVLKQLSHILQSFLDFIISNRVSFLCSGRPRLWSSYLCFPHSWMINTWHCLLFFLNWVRWGSWELFAWVGLKQWSS